MLQGDPETNERSDKKAVHERHNLVELNEVDVWKLIKRRIDSMQRYRDERPGEDPIEQAMME